MPDTPGSSGRVSLPDAELHAIERRAGLRASGKRYSIEPKDYPQAVQDVRYLLGVIYRMKEKPDV